MCIRIVAAVSMAAAVSAAMAQELQWVKRLDDGSAVHNTEVALGVSPSGLDVMVAWMHWIDTGPYHVYSRLYYSISTDGSSFSASPGPVPLPDPAPPGTGPHGADPMVEFAPDGTGFVGYVQMYGAGAVRDRFWVAEKEPAAAQAQPASPMVMQNLDPDKGVLAFGWLAGQGEAQLTLTWAHSFGGGPSNPRRLRAAISPDHGQSWGPNFLVGEEPQGNAGDPNRAVILRHAPAAGRWVVAHLRDLPWATYSDDSGQSWTNSVQPTRATNPNNPLATELISNISNPIATGMVADTINAPDLAADPSNDSTIYMIFSGRTASTGFNNADLFIARSTDGGADFSRANPQAQHGTNVRHLRDADLGVPAEDIPTHQFHPAITVDIWGGLNIMYYASRRNPQTQIWEYRVEYARIPQFTNAQPAGIVVLPLTTWFNMENLGGWHTKLFGHYMYGGSRIRQVYFPFISRHEDLSEPPGVYVAYVDLCLDADTNRDQQLTTADIELFVNLFAAEDPRADLDGDNQFTLGDVNRFWASYNCACNP
jgi:hypothetical protein